MHNNDNDDNNDDHNDDDDNIVDYGVDAQLANTQASNTIIVIVSSNINIILIAVVFKILIAASSSSLPPSQSSSPRSSSTAAPTTTRAVYCFLFVFLQFSGSSDLLPPQFVCMFWVSCRFQTCGLRPLRLLSLQQSLPSQMTWTGSKGEHGPRKLGWQPFSRDKKSD
jgi:hypothetical protein